MNSPHPVRSLPPVGFGGVGMRMYMQPNGHWWQWSYNFGTTRIVAMGALFIIIVRILELGLLIAGIVFLVSWMRGRFHRH